MALSKTRRAELEAELLQVMDKLDALKVELREQLQDHRVQVKLYAEKLKSLRDILSGREGEQSVIPGCETGAVKPPAPRPAKPGPLPIVYGTARVRGEITRWKADGRARKVPNFVVDQTGLKTKAQVIAKYGDGVTFEKGKPAPKDSRPAPKKPDHLARHMAQRDAEEKAAPKSLAWTEGDGTQQVVVGSTTYRAQEITPTRWVLESKSERERAWHKETVQASQSDCERWVVERHPGSGFAEVCLDCGVAANQPSEGCDGCAHGKAAANG